MKYGNQVISSIRLGSQVIITKIAKGLTIVYEAWKTLIKRGKTPLTITNCQPDTTAIDYTIYGGNDFKSILPNGYQQVEYIQTTGTQYIDSKVPLKGGLKTIVDWIYEDTTGSNSYTGGHIGSPGNRWLIGSQRQNGMYFFAVGTGNTTTGIQFGNRDVVEAYWADRASYIKVNGVQSTYTFDHLTLGDEPNYTFYISAVNRNGSASSRSKLTIYSWKFYQDDILIRDYVPCYRKSDKVAGLYDVVTNEFYTNDGTGEFIVGEPTFPSPTPDAPIKMKGVGDKTINLFENIEPLWISTTGLISYNTGRGLIIPAAEGEEYSAYAKWDAAVGNNIILLACLDENQQLITGYRRVHNAVAEGLTNVICPAGTAYLLCCHYATVPNQVMLLRGMYTSASSLPSYEPTGYKIPIKVGSENLFNVDSFAEAIGEYFGSQQMDNDINFNLFNTNGAWNKKMDFNGKENEQYILSFKYKMSSGIYVFATYYSDGTKLNHTVPTSTEWAEGSITTPANKTLVGIGGSGTQSTKELYVGNIRLEEQPIVTNIYLNEPLTKVGTCANKLTYSAQSIIQSLGHYQFDGSENWEEHTAAQGCKVYRLDGVLTPKTGAFMSDTYMTHFGLTYTYSTSAFIPGFYRFASGNTVDIISSSRLYISSTCETVEEFKEWLSVNKPSIYYPLAEAETINIELPGLYLPNETNIITVDTEVSPDEIEITYKGRE